jgi:hypothetical protein
MARTSALGTPRRGWRGQSGSGLLGVGLLAKLSQSQFGTVGVSLCRRPFASKPRRRGSRLSANGPQFQVATVGVSRCRNPATRPTPESATVPACNSDPFALPQALSPPCRAAEGLAYPRTGHSPSLQLRPFRPAAGPSASEPRRRRPRLPANGPQFQLATPTLSRCRSPATRPTLESATVPGCNADSFAPPIQPRPALPPGLHGLPRSTPTVSLKIRHPDRPARTADRLRWQKQTGAPRCPRPR